MLAGVLVDDAILPAAPHLTGPSARRVLAAAVEAAGGQLGDARPCHLQYRPGRDVVVRYDGRVRWRGGPAVPETLMAATTTAGPPRGTLAVEATTVDGGRLAVGVWRWPFDPVVTGLADAVTPSGAATFLDGLVRGVERLEVVAYRPTLRAVVRVEDDDGTVVYVKAVPPAEVLALVARHEHLLAAGVPVPIVIRSDVAKGLVAMEALRGPTIRDRIKDGQRGLPGPDQYDAVSASLAGVDLPGAAAVEGRAGTALRHVVMLAAVLPGDAGRLDRLAELLAPAADRARDRVGPTIHGDLYEAQLVTGTGRGRTATITGVLDLDDAGPGDPIDDRATVVAHLLSRALDETGHERGCISGYALSLRRAFGQAVDPIELDLVIAGALVGLATGPFRLQLRQWRHGVRRRLAIAERLARAPGERTFRISS